MASWILFKWAVFAVIAVVSCGVNSDVATSVVVVVVTDGVDPVTGVCADFRDGSGQDDDGDRSFLELVKWFMYLINGVGVDGFKASSPMVVLVETGCEEPADGVIQNIVGIKETRTLAGVVTITRGHTARAVAEFVRHFSVPIVEIVSGDVMTSTSSGRHHYVVPHYTYWQIQNALFVASIFNWTALTLAEQDNISGDTSITRDLFKRLTFEKGICSLSRFPRSSAPVVMLQPGSNVSMASAYAESRVVLIIGDPSNEMTQSKVTNDKGHILHLLPVDSDWLSLEEVVTDECNSSSMNNQTYYNSNNTFQNFCLGFSDLNFGTKYYLQQLIRSLSFVLSKSETAKNEHSCSTSDISQECLLYRNYETVQDLNSNFLYTMSKEFKILVWGNSSDNSTEYDSKNEGRYTLLVSSLIPSTIMNKHCGNVCNKCEKCFPTKLSESKLLTSGHGDAYIAGFFPVHQSSKNGLCDVPNLRGYLAAIAFIEAVKAHRDSLGLFRISGAVFDSCGSPKQVACTINSLETCAVYFQENVNNITTPTTFESTSIISYVNGDNSLDLSPYVSGKPVLSIQDWGYSTEKESKQTFVDNILKSLLHIHWTVFHIIVTDEEPFRTLSKLVKNSRLSNSFCIPHEIIIPSTIANENNNLDIILNLTTKTSLFFLLTNQQNTDQVFQHLQSISNNISTRVSLILTPLSRESYQAAEVSTFADFIIRFQPAVRNAAQNSLDQINRTISLKHTAWSREFSNITSQAFTSFQDLALTLQGTEELLASLENDDFGRLEGKLRASGLDVTAVDVRHNKETLVAFVGKELTHINPLVGPLFNTCRGWCPACHACNVMETETRRHTSFYLDGDVQITGVFPLHEQGDTTLSCGVAQSELDKLLKVQAFIYAVESFKTRHPSLLPGLAVGGLVLDSCSCSVTALRTIIDFQTCTLKFAGHEVKKLEDHKHSTVGDPKQYNTFSNPTKNLAYFVDPGDNNTDYIKRGLEIANLDDVVFVNDDSSLFTTTTNTEVGPDFSHNIIQILTSLGWNKIIIILEDILEFQREVKVLLSEAHKYNICAVAVIYFSTSDMASMGRHLEQYRGMPVVLLSRKETGGVVFHSLRTIGNSNFWIIPAYHESWRNRDSVVEYLPLGSIFIDLKVEKNVQFNSFLHNLTSDPTFSSSLSHWFKDFWRFRYKCYFRTDDIRDPDSEIECPLTAPVSDVQISSSHVYNVIRTVDAVLHSVHAEYAAKCPFMAGICEQFAEGITNRRLSVIPGPRGVLQGQQLDNTFDGQPFSKLSVFNVQRDGFVLVGSYSKPSLSLNITKIQLYTDQGLELNQIPRFVCVTDCHCLDTSSDNDTFLADMSADVNTTTNVEFIYEVWAMIVIAVGFLGALVSLVFAAYVVFKVSKGALGRRYVGLGLTLLFSLVLLFLTILPFVISANETVCGLRYLLPGLSYTLCFAVILVKLMSLQSYKLIGLGGEISGLNQFLTVFFIVGVQVAVGVQCWLSNQTNMHAVQASLGVHKYTCAFSRVDFALYQVYVMLLIAMCCLYSVGVRKEKKNMGEAKLLLACSWTCLAIWLIWLPCFFLLDHKWSDIIICASILACAAATLITIFVPKIRMVSRLKYDVTQKAHFRNGHSVDTDFLYERPYSLPGTLTSTFSSGKMNYPKTFSHFDTEVNY